MILVLIIDFKNQGLKTYDLRPCNVFYFRVNPVFILDSLLFNLI